MASFGSVPRSKEEDLDPLPLPTVPLDYFLKMTASDDSRGSEALRALKACRGEVELEGERAPRLIIGGVVVIGDLQRYRQHLPHAAKLPDPDEIRSQADDPQEQARIAVPFLAYAFVPTLIQAVENGFVDLESLKQGLDDFMERCDREISSVYLDARSLSSKDIELIIEAYSREPYCATSFTILDGATSLEDELNLSDVEIAIKVNFNESIETEAQALGPLHFVQHVSETGIEELGRLIPEFYEEPNPVQGQDG